LSRLPSFPPRRSSDLIPHATLLLAGQRIGLPSEVVCHRARRAGSSAQCPSQMLRACTLRPLVPRLAADANRDARPNGQEYKALRSEEHTSELQSREKL